MRNLVLPEKNRRALLRDILFELDALPANAKLRPEGIEKLVGSMLARIAADTTYASVSEREAAEKALVNIHALISEELMVVFDRLSLNGELEARALANLVHIKMEAEDDHFAGLADAIVKELHDRALAIVKGSVKSGGASDGADLKMSELARDAVLAVTTHYDEETRNQIVEGFVEGVAAIDKRPGLERGPRGIGIPLDAGAAGPAFHPGGNWSALRSEAALVVAKVRLLHAQRNSDKAEDRYAEIAGLRHADFVERCLTLSKDLPLPDPVTANNLEVGAMSTAHFMVRLGLKMNSEGDAAFDFLSCYNEYDRLKKVVSRILMVVDRLGWRSGLSIREGADIGLMDFLQKWHLSSYARLEIGHKIAASFCLTDVPDGVVESPWQAWSLVVPDGLLGPHVARVWVVGIDPRFIIGRDGRRYRPTRVEGEMIESLVRSSAMALSEPDDFKKDKKHSPTAKSKKRHGDPDLSQATFLLSAPIEVDLRENVAAALEDERLGRKHASPKVQFLVRGHPRQQAHGAGRALRKLIWVKPFWKGPEGGKVLLRKYRVDDDEGND